MKARFGLQQQPVKIVAKEGIAYIFIYLNETQGQETYPNMGEGQITENYYEYDYNEIVGPEAELPIEDIQAHPENYITYEAPKKKTIEERLAELENSSEAINKALLS